MNRTIVTHPVFVSLILLLASGSVHAADVRHEIHFPELPGYRTLKCDFHMHTVFSDGTVWPPVRVAEAWQQGLDAIAITDHIEYQPHRKDLPTNHNRPFELARGAAQQHGILLPKAAEITRDTPPGHFNALFLSDVNPLATKEFLDAVKKAKEQDAFVFWNHHDWKGPEKGRWMDVHTTMFESKSFQGMEIANGSSYYPSAHKWCLEKNLTMIGTSDIHNPDQRKRSTSGDHRTMTLVFAKEKTLPSLKEALLEGRTVVWYKDQLIGRKEYLEPLLKRSIGVAPPNLRTGREALVEIRNLCEADIHLKRTGKLGPAELALPARTTKLVKIRVGNPNEPFRLEYNATNFLVEPDKGLPIVLEVGKAEDSGT